MRKPGLLIALGLTLGLVVTALIGWPTQEAALAQGPVGTLLPPGFSTLMPTGISTSVATLVPPGAATLIPKTPVAPPPGGGGGQAPTQPAKVTASPQATTTVPQATATTPPTSAPAQPPRAASPTPKTPGGPCPSGVLLPGMVLGGAFITRSLRRR